MKNIIKFSHYCAENVQINFKEPFPVIGGYNSVKNHEVWAAIVQGNFQTNFKDPSSESTEKDDKVKVSSTIAVDVLMSPYTCQVFLTRMLNPI